MVTTSPGAVAPESTRETPTVRTTSTPRLGRAAKVGSKAARIRPTLMLVSRSSWAFAANRAVSCGSRPRVLTTMAPSNDSCATSLSWARSCWARVAQPCARRW